MSAILAEALGQKTILLFVGLIVFAFRGKGQRRAIVEPKFSSWSKTELWQVVDVKPMPVFGKFYNG